MRKFIRGIKNVFKWLPIIWRSEDDNYGELYDVMIHKLTLMANHFEEHGEIEYDSVDLVKEMRNNAARLKSAKAETFVNIAINKYKEQYYIDMANCTDAELKKEIVTTFKFRIANARKLDLINKRKAFKVFGENINRWWLRT